MLHFFIDDIKVCIVQNKNFTLSYKARLINILNNLDKEIENLKCELEATKNLKCELQAIKQVLDKQP